MWNYFAQADADVSLVEVRRVSETIFTSVGISSDNAENEERHIYQFSCDIPRLGMENYQQLFEYL